MKIKIENFNPYKKKTSMLCGFVLEGQEKILGLNRIDSKDAPLIKQAISDLKGRFGKISVIPSNSNAQRILLAGLGKREEFTNDTIRFVSGKIAQKAQELKLKEFSIITPPSIVIDSSLSTSQIVEGCKMALYKFEDYKSEEKTIDPVVSIIVSSSDKVTKAIKTAEIISEGAIYTKSIGRDGEGTVEIGDIVYDVTWGQIERFQKVR